MSHAEEAFIDSYIGWFGANFTGHRISPFSSADASLGEIHRKQSGYVNTYRGKKLHFLIDFGEDVTYSLKVFVEFFYLFFIHFLSR